MSYLIVLTILIFKQRQLDFISLYAFCLLLFNLTTFLRVVNNPYTGLFIAPDDSLYLVSSIPFYCLIPFFYMQKYEVNKYQGNVTQNMFYKGQTPRLVMFILLMVFIFALLDNYESLFLSESKVELLENSKMTSVLLGSIPAVGLIISFNTKNRIYNIVFVFLVFVVFLTGARRPLAVLVLCFIINWMFDHTIIISHHFKLLLTAFLGLLIIILGKKIYGFILLYGFSEGISMWYDNFDILYLKEGSEFLGTSTILNSVILTDFSTSSVDVFTSLLAILPIPMSVWGLSSSMFNDAFQSTLFPGINYGMAYNIWAEGYSWLGLFGVFIYGLVIPMLLVWLWELYAKHRYRIFGALLLLLGVTFSFWIHRNSLGSILAYIRNPLYPILLIFFVSYILRMMFKNKNI